MFGQIKWFIRNIRLSSEVEEYVNNIYESIERMIYEYNNGNKLNFRSTYNEEIEKIQNEIITTN